jgi:hypothetical protein
VLARFRLAELSISIFLIGNCCPAAAGRAWPERREERQVSRKVLTIYAVVAAAGVIAGLANYVATRRPHQALVHHPAANAIGVHVVLAAMAGCAMAGGYVISRHRGGVAQQGDGVPRGYARFWRAPFTGYGWRQTRYALMAAPFGCAAFLLTIAGQVRVAQRLERWRLRRVLGRPTGRGPDGRPVRVAAYLLASLPIGIALSAAAAIAVFSIFRAGLQITSLAPEGNINAWGGPTYLGALLAHWLDSFILFYTCMAILGALTRLQATWARAPSALPRGSTPASRD